jgi:hypothetical protein
MRRCYKCQELKDVSLFRPRRQKGRGSYDCICRSCENLARTQRGRKRATPEVETLINSIRQRGCQNCGEPEVIVLQFHHIDPAEKEFVIGQFRRQAPSLEATVKELRKCALLCANCHIRAHAGLVPAEKLTPVM